MDGFDFFPANTQPSQTSAPGLGHAPAPRAGLDSLDLNLQVPPAENFPHLHAYGAFLQGHGEEGAGLDHGSGYPPPRAPRTLGVPHLTPGLGRGWVAPPAPRACQLQFSASSSAGGSSGGGGDGMPPWPDHGGDSSSGAGGGGRVRAKVSSAGRHRTHSSSSNRGRASSRGGRGGRAARGASHFQAPSGNYINDDEEEGYEEEVEDLGSSGGPPDESNEQMHVEEADGGSTSSSEDEVISMCRKNLKMATDFVVQLVPILGMYSDNHFVKLPPRSLFAPESGLQWVQRTLTRDSSCYKMFRVERPLFNRLHNTLVESYGLQSTTKMSSVEALAMFLWVLGAPQSVRQAEDRLIRSLEIISRTFDTVLTCVLRLAPDIIKPKDPEFSEVHPNLENPDFWPHFNNCIGAIDGTHVKVVVPKSKRIQYLNRHNETSQNVLAVCDFDMRFTFVLSGWPGSAHDMRVFKDAMTTHVHKFPHPPPGKYYVVDARYPNRKGYLSPYRCTRYHVEQWQNGPPPQDMCLEH